MKSSLSVTTVSILAAALATACAYETAPDRSSTDEVAAALDMENGGMDNEDETIDESKYEDIPVFEDVDDPTTLEAENGSRVITMLVLWGHLPRYDGVDPETFTDWTGSVQVKGGKLRIDRTVAFDAHDKLLARSTGDQASFVSRTLPHVDGLMMHVLQKSSAATLTISTRALTVDIPLSGVAPSIAGHEMLDEANGLTYYGYENRPGCGDGLLFGRYRRMSSDVGRFHFRVVSDHGAETGRVRGIYGYSYRRDAQVFFGKVLGFGGAYRGLVGGNYGEGHFSGLWRTDTPNAGVMGGLYFEGYDDRPGHGLAFGRWSEACSSTDNAL